MIRAVINNEQQGRKALTFMPAADVIEFCRLMEHVGAKVWIDGGWGVDALLERQTRAHKDLDIVIQQNDLEELRRLLGARGYGEIKLEIARRHNFVMGDDQDREIDVHVIRDRRIRQRDLRPARSK